MNKKMLNDEWQSDVVELFISAVTEQISEEIKLTK